MAKILELIPKDLHEDLFAEVLEAIAQKEKEEQEKSKNEVSPMVREYLAREKKAREDQARHMEEMYKKY